MSETTTAIITPPGSHHAGRPWHHRSTCPNGLCGGSAVHPSPDRPGFHRTRARPGRNMAWPGSVRADEQWRGCTSDVLHVMAPIPRCVCPRTVKFGTATAKEGGCQDGRARISRRGAATLLTSANAAPGGESPRSRLMGESVGSCPNGGAQASRESRVRRSGWRKLTEKQPHTRVLRLAVNCSIADAMTSRLLAAGTGTLRHSDTGRYCMASLFCAACSRPNTGVRIENMSAPDN